MNIQSLTVYIVLPCHFWARKSPIGITEEINRWIPHPSHYPPLLCLCFEQRSSLDTTKEPISMTGRCIDPYGRWYTTRWGHRPEKHISTCLQINWWCNWHLDCGNQRNHVGTSRRGNSLGLLKRTWDGCCMASGWWALPPFSPDGKLAVIACICSI